MHVHVYMCQLLYLHSMRDRAPMEAGVTSLNVSCATAILLHQLLWPAPKRL